MSYTGFGARVEPGDCPEGQGWDPDCMRCMAPRPTCPPDYSPVTDCDAGQTVCLPPLAPCPEAAQASQEVCEQQYAGYWGWLFGGCADCGKRSVAPAPPARSQGAAPTRPPTAATGVSSAESNVVPWIIGGIVVGGVVLGAIQLMQRRS